MVKIKRWRCPRTNRGFSRVVVKACDWRLRGCRFKPQAAAAMRIPGTWLAIWSVARPLLRCKYFLYKDSIIISTLKLHLICYLESYLLWCFSDWMLEENDLHRLPQFLNINSLQHSIDINFLFLHVRLFVPSCKCKFFKIKGLLRKDNCVSILGKRRVTELYGLTSGNVSPQNISTCNESYLYLPLCCFVSAFRTSEGL